MSDDPVTAQTKMAIPNAEIVVKFMEETFLTPRKSAAVRSSAELSRPPSRFSSKTIIHPQRNPAPLQNQAHKGSPWVLSGQHDRLKQLALWVLVCLHED